MISKRRVEDMCLADCWKYVRERVNEHVNVLSHVDWFGLATLPVLMQEEIQKWLV